MMSERVLPLRRSLAVHIAVALIVVKLAWALVVLGAGGFDLRWAEGADVLRFASTFIAIPVHLVLGGLFWFGKKWAAYALIVVAIAGALGAGGAGLLYGLPHALDGNYDRDGAMVPFEVVAIAINFLLALSLWRATRVNHDIDYNR